MNVHVRTTLAVVLSAGLGLAGCDARSPVAPTAPSVRSSQHASEGAPGRVIACERRRVTSDSAAIGPAGGILRVGNNELLVPPGALLETVMVRGEVPDDTIASIRLFPAGLTFRRPAALALDVQGCEDPGSKARVFYLSDDGTILEEIDAVYFPAWKRVAAPIDHFSRYALGV